MMMELNPTDDSYGTVHRRCIVRKVAAPSEGFKVNVLVAHIMMMAITASVDS